MRKFTLYIIGLLLCIIAPAQTLKTPLLQKYVEGLIGTPLFVQYPTDGSNTAEIVGKILAQKLMGNYPAPTTLQLNYTRTSPSGVYYFYTLNYKKTVLYRRTLKVFVDKNNTIRWIHHNFTPFVAPTTSTFLNTTEVGNFATTNFPNYQLLAGTSTWLHNGQTIIPSFSITVKNEKEGTTQYVYSTAGMLLYTHPIDKHFATIDTPTYGYVYNPDPLTTAQVSYGGAYSNNNGADTNELTAERKKVTFYGTLQGDSIILANADFFMSEVSTPSFPPTRIALGDTFNYTRSQHQFASVNAFYHLNTHLSHIRKLGFNSLPNFRIRVDAHALNGQDASRFTATDNPPTLQFGDGGIPDAEDADVIIHEFGHALSHSASPNTAIGIQRRALDEAFGDYFSASYSWGISTFNWQKVFNWDGNNGGWQGRTVDYKGSYKQLTNNIWIDGQLWSTAFMRLLRIIGRDKADALMLEALYRLNSNMSMRQLANAVQQIDTLQNSGANFEPIQCAFASVDILDSLSACLILSVKNSRQNKPVLFKLYNSWGFAINAEDAEIYFSSPARYQLTIFDATGKLILNETISGSAPKKVKGQNFAPGVYFLKISEKNTGKTQTAKLLRY